MKNISNISIGQDVSAPASMTANDPFYLMIPMVNSGRLAATTNQSTSPGRKKSALVDLDVNGPPTATYCSPHVPDFSSNKKEYFERHEITSAKQSHNVCVLCIFSNPRMKDFKLQDHKYHFLSPLRYAK
jgi:hypothetical protein